MTHTLFVKNIGVIFHYVETISAHATHKRVK